MAKVKNINMAPDTIPPYMKLSQYDVGRVIDFVMKEDSADYTVPAGATITLEGTKPSGLGFTIACTVVGNVAAIETTAGMTDEYGTVTAELVVRVNNTRIGSSNIRFEIEKSPHPEGTTDGSAEVIIPIMTQLVMRVEAAVAKAEVLSEAEAWAVGQRDGVDVDVDDDTYHNNAKYYKEQAATSAQTASDKATAAGNAKTAAEKARDEAQTAHDEIFDVLNNATILDTTETVTFNSDNLVQQIVHTSNETGLVVRTDVFTYNGDVVTEVRTAADGRTQTNIYNLETLSQQFNV